MTTRDVHIRCVNLLYVALSIFTFSTNQQTAYAYNYSVKHAFCVDYGRGRTSIYRDSYHYDFERYYQECMRDADSLIRKYEVFKKKQRQQRNAERRKQEKKWQIQEEERMRENAEKKRLEYIRKKKMKDTLDNADQLFR